MGAQYKTSLLFYVRNGLIALFFFTSLNTFSQNRIKGHVRDDMNKNVIGATLTLFKINSEIIQCFTTTDDSGLFSFDLDECECDINKDSVKIHISAMEFFTKIISITNIEPLEIVLTKDSTRFLPEVVVTKKRLPILLRPDTLKISVEKLSDQSDKSIGDVIKKIPGIEIDTDGKIKYNGKQLHALYIDGIDLLGNRYNIGSNNLSNRLVSEIQVIENHQPIKLLESLTGGDKVAINLKLTDSAKVKPIYNLQGGGGLSNSIVAQTDNSIVNFTKKLHSINTIKYNNSGNDLSTEIKNNGTSESIIDLQVGSSNRVLLPNMQSSIGINPNKYLFNNGYLMTTNNVIVNNGLQSKFGGYYLNDNQTQQIYSSVDYAFSNAQFKINQSFNNKIRKKDFGAYYILHKNSDKLYFNNVTKFDYSGLSLSGFGVTNNTTNYQNFAQSVYTIYNENQYLRTTSKGWLFEWKSLIALYSRPEGMNIAPGIYGTFLNNNQPYEDLSQDVTTRNLFINSFISWKKVNRKLQSTYTLGITNGSEHMNSSLVYTFQNSQVVKIDSNFLNNRKYVQKRISATITLDLYLNSGNIMLGLPLSGLSNSFQNPTSMGGANSTARNLIFAPFINYRTKISKYQELFVTYAYNKNIGGHQNIAFEKILTNNSLIRQNSVPFNETATHFSQILYTYRNIKNLFFLNSSFTFNQSRNNFISDFAIYPAMLIQKDTLYPNTNYSYQFSNLLSKYFLSLKSTISTRLTYSYSSFNLSQNTIKLRGKTNTYSLTFNSRTTISKKSQFSFASSLSISNTSFLNVKVPTTKAWQNNLSFTYFPTPFFSIIIKGDQFSYIRDNILPNSILLFDTEIIIAPKKTRMKFSVDLMNLLNVRNYEMYYLFNNEVGQSNTPLRERTIMIKTALSF